MLRLVLACAACVAGFVVPATPRRGVLRAVVERDEFEATMSGLKFKDEVVGEGAEPKSGDIVIVDYRGCLATSGTEFDSSYSRGAPFSFELGKGRVIPGWDEGLSTMRVGGKRTLLIPPHLAYGDREVGGGRIPANSELLFHVELKDVKSGAMAQAAMKADMTLQNVVANFGLNPFTFFVVLFLLLSLAPAFLPDESPLMYGDMPNPFESASLDTEMNAFLDTATPP
mmetsp:Transcript_7184/g.21909  ORF Transcript_7184/g.21909 Transcript_7184/m.21909 type:complete len:227 (+) Transcript_7184:33-713(+)